MFAGSHAQGVCRSRRSHTPSQFWGLLATTLKVCLGLLSTWRTHLPPGFSLSDRCLRYSFKINIFSLTKLSNLGRAPVLHAAMQSRHMMCFAGWSTLCLLLAILFQAFWVSANTNIFLAMRLTNVFWVKKLHKHKIFYFLSELSKMVAVLKYNKTILNARLQTCGE